jgi:hypothetical protein
VEALLFYHPCVWWLSRRVRAERELCCDDVAVAFGGDAAFYARTLNRLDDLRTPAPALAAGGGNLMLRIKRLLAPRPDPTRVPWAALLCAGVLTVSGASLWARSTDTPPAPKPSAPASRPAKAPVTVQAQPVPREVKEAPAKAPEAPGTVKESYYTRQVQFEWREGVLFRLQVKNLSTAEVLEVLKKIDVLAEEQQGKGRFGGGWDFPGNRMSEKDAEAFKTFTLENVTTGAVRRVL